MRKVIFILAMMLAGIFGAMAAPKAASDTLTAAGVFREIPLQVLELLRPSTRLDMLDYYEQADSLLQAPNAMEGYSQLQIVEPDYLKVTISPVSILEIKILPGKKGQIAMTIYTVGSEEVNKDSSVEFFDSSLQPLRRDDYLKMPDLKDYFNLKDSGISLRELRDALPFQTVEYTTGPGSTPLTATFTTLGNAPEETRKKFEPLLRAPLTLTWKGRYEQGK